MWLTLPLKVNGGVNAESNSDKDLSAQNNLSAHLSAQNNLSTHLSAQQMQIISIIKTNPSLSIPEIAETMGVKESYIRSQRRAMGKYIELRRNGSRKTGTWEIIVK